MLIFGNQNLTTTVRAEKYVLVIMPLPQHDIQLVRNRLVVQYVELHLSGIHVIITTRWAIRTDIPVVRTSFGIPEIYQSSLALEAVIQTSKQMMIQYNYTEPTLKRGIFYILKFSPKKQNT